MLVVVTHRRAHQRVRPHQVRGEAERTDIVAQARQPQGGLEVAKVLEQPRPVRPVGHLLLFGLREAGGDELLHVPGAVVGRDDAVAGVGQRAGAVDDLLQHRVEVEARADAQDSVAQPGDALLERLDLSPQRGGTLLHGFTSKSPARGRRKQKAPGAVDRQEIAFLSPTSLCTRQKYHTGSTPDRSDADRPAVLAVLGGGAAVRVAKAGVRDFVGFGAILGERRPLQRFNESTCPRVSARYSVQSSIRWRRRSNRSDRAYAASVWSRTAWARAASTTSRG